jgi:hypothetical protein
MLVHRGVPLALIAAAPADGQAGLQQRPDDVGVPFGRAADDPDSGGTDIDTVRHSRMHLTISVTFCSAKSAALSAVQA